MITKHREKIKLARKLYRESDKEARNDLFGSDLWLKRKEGIRKRVQRKQTLAHERALKRKEEAKKSSKTPPNQ